jgi:hypothetical protein
VPGGLDPSGGWEAGLIPVLPRNGIEVRIVTESWIGRSGKGVESAWTSEPKPALGSLPTDAVGGQEVIAMRFGSYEVRRAPLRAPPGSALNLTRTEHGHPFEMLPGCVAETCHSLDQLFTSISLSPAGSEHSGGKDWLFIGMIARSPMPATT